MGAGEPVTEHLGRWCRMQWVDRGRSFPLATCDFRMYGTLFAGRWLNACFSLSRYLETKLFFDFKFQCKTLISMWLYWNVKCSSADHAKPGNRPC